MKPIRIVVALIIFLYSCKKEEGLGGTARIRGKIYATYYDKYFYTIAHAGYASDIDVYIIFGDDVTYGEKQKTSYDGYYEFKYVRPGKYKIYAYSRDSTGAYKNQTNQYNPDVAIITEVEVKEKREIVMAPQLDILQ